MAARADVFEKINRNGFESVNGGLRLIGKEVEDSRSILKDSCDLLDSKLDESLRRTDLAKIPGQEALELLNRFETVI